LRGLSPAAAARRGGTHGPVQHNASLDQRFSVVVGMTAADWFARERLNPIVVTLH